MSKREEDKKLNVDYEAMTYKKPFSKKKLHADLDRLAKEGWYVAFEFMGYIALRRNIK